MTPHTAWRSAVPILVASALACACSRQRPLHTQALAHRAHEEVTVYFRDGRMETTTARPGPGGETWLLGPLDDAVPLEDIRAIRHTDRASGAITGLGLGLSTGAIGGGLLGWATYSPPSCAKDEPSTTGGSKDDPLGLDDGLDLCLDFGPGASALAGVIIGGLVGGVVGLLVGAGNGNSTWYGPPIPRKGTKKRAARLLIVPADGGGMVGVGGAF